MKVNWDSEIDLINIMNDISSLDYYIIILNRVVDNIINKMKKIIFHLHHSQLILSYLFSSISCVYPN